MIPGAIDKFAHLIHPSQPILVEPIASEKIPGGIATIHPSEPISGGINRIQTSEPTPGEIDKIHASEPTLGDPISSVSREKILGELVFRELAPELKHSLERGKPLSAFEEKAAIALIKHVGNDKIAKTFRRFQRDLSAYRQRLPQDEYDTLLDSLWEKLSCIACATPQGSVDDSLEVAGQFLRDRRSVSEMRAIFLQKEQRHLLLEFVQSFLESRECSDDAKAVFLTSVSDVITNAEHTPLLANLVRSFLPKVIDESVSLSLRLAMLRALAFDFRDCLSDFSILGQIKTFLSNSEDSVLSRSLWCVFGLLAVDSEPDLEGFGSDSARANAAALEIAMVRLGNSAPQNFALNFSNPHVGLLKCAALCHHAISCEVTSSFFRNLFRVAGIVIMTSKSVQNDDTQCAARNVADLTSDSFFNTKDEPGPWICWNFRERCVRPIDYTIKSHLLDSRVIETAADVKNQTEMHQKTHDPDLSYPIHMSSFAVLRSTECHFIRLTQTDLNQWHNNSLAISVFEFLGIIIE
jgi:hypothetical protein